MKKIEENFPVVVGPDLGPRFNNIKELMAYIPSMYSYDYCDGRKEEGTSAILIAKDGTRISVTGNDRYEYANNYTPNYDCEGTSIGEAIALAKSEIISVEITCKYECSWEDDTDGSQFCETVTIPIRPIDWAKVRRRLEDCLRKDPEALRIVIAILGIPLI